MHDRELAPHWRSKHCMWEVYSRCTHARCEHRDKPCPEAEDCPQRDQRPIRQITSDLEADYKPA